MPKSKPKSKRFTSEGLKRMFAEDPRIQKLERDLMDQSAKGTQKRNMIRKGRADIQKIKLQILRLETQIRQIEKRIERDRAYLKDDHTPSMVMIRSHVRYRKEQIQKAVQEDIYISACEQAGIPVQRKRVKVRRTGLRKIILQCAKEKFGPGVSFSLTDLCQTLIRDYEWFSCRATIGRTIRLMCDAQILIRENPQEKAGRPKGMAGKHDEPIYHLNPKRQTFEDWRS